MSERTGAEANERTGGHAGESRWGGIVLVGLCAVCFGAITTVTAYFVARF
jgi:uncharacterized membrane protein